MHCEVELPGLIQATFVPAENAVAWWWGAGEVAAILRHRLR